MYTMKTISPVKIILLIVFIAFFTQCNQKAPPDKVEININDTGQPIEKYVYGQFIEHLGNCIYGGIWAEMVEDRKFYYPITPEFNPYATRSDEFWGTGPYQYLDASPWEIIGNPYAVTMEKQNPFVGEHAVSIAPTGDGPVGIRQYALGTIEGKGYTGRIIIKGEPSVLPITIRLKKSEDVADVVTIDDISSSYATYPFSFVSSFSSDSVVLEIFSEGEGRFNIGTLSIMPDDNIKGWRKDVVALMKELNSPVYRWPGGNFVSGYNWRDGIGERDKRPPRKNPAWTGVEPNDVGIHEYMELMEILDSEAFIAVNTGLGTVKEVAEEVEYVNGPVTSEWGSKRAENGHPEPYNVKWWAVGNEMYGDWQLGHMPLSDYVKKHNKMADAIWDVDPNAKLIGVGAIGEWSETMLSESADKMNLLSEHIYCRELDSVEAHINQIANSIKTVADSHRMYHNRIQGLEEKNIRIAMDEWNYWYGDYIYGELGVRYHHKDALGIAKGLHEFFRNSDIFFMANYAQTVNVIGCIKATTTKSGFATTAMPLILYRKHFETIPVNVVDTIPGLDLAAAISPDKKVVTLAMVNSSKNAIHFSPDFGTTELSDQGTKWLIHHENPEAFNLPGETPEVDIQESDFSMDKTGIEVPAYSIMLIKFDLL